MTDEKPPRRPPWPRAVDSVPAGESSSPIAGEADGGRVISIGRASWRKRVADAITDWRTILVGVLALVGALVWAVRRVDDLATKADVASARKSADEAIALHAIAIHPLSLARLDAVEDRVLVLEVSLTWLVKATESIAHRVGATTPPAPQPPQP